MKRLAPAAAILLAAVFISFLPAMRAKYTNWDDPTYVGAARQPLPQLLKMVVTGHWHPLTMLSLGADVRLFGMNATEMHAVNVVLHAIAALLILVLLDQLTGNVWAALAGALFFAIHPLRVESVAWVSERKDVLMGVFFAAALVAYVAHRRRGVSLAWTYLFYVLALLAKLTAISLPFALLAIDYFDEQRFRIRDKIPMFVLSVAGAIGAIVALNSTGGVLSVFDFAAWQRPLLAAHAIVMYLSREIVPVNLSAYYAYHKTLTPADWTSFAAILILGIAVLASARRFPRVFAGVAFFFVTIAPMLPLMATGNAIITDRYTYLPSIGLAMILSLLATHISLRALAAATVAFGALLGALTWQRCTVWYDARTLWMSVVDYDPTAAIAWNNLAHERMADGDWRGAFVAVDRALQLDPCYPTALHNHALWLTLAGRYDLALNDMAQALRCNPVDARAWQQKGEILRKSGHPAAAQRCFAQAAKLSGAPIAVPSGR